VQVLPTDFHQLLVVDDIDYALKNLPQSFCQTQLYKSLHHESFAAFPDSMGRRLSRESLNFYAFKSLLYNCHVPIGLQCRSAHQLTLTHLLNKCNRVTITLSPSSCFSFTRTRKKSLLSCGLLFTTKLQTQHTCNKVHTKSNSISLVKGLELLPILQSHKCTNNVGIQVQQKIAL
jgi:hypothetical protein